MLPEADHPKKLRGRWTENHRQSDGSLSAGHEICRWRQSPWRAQRSSLQIELDIAFLAVRAEIDGLPL